jgi:uncharacterized protein (TIGR02147 family)
MVWENELRKILVKDFEEKRKRNPKFSMRAYSKHLGISPATLSLILREAEEQRGWSLSIPRAAAIIDKTAQPQAVKNRFRALINLPTQRKRELVKGTEEKILTEWPYLAILAAHELPPALRSAASLSARFHLEESRVTQVIRELVEMKLLQANQEDAQVLERSAAHLGTKDGPPSEVIRHFHRQNLKLALRALDEVETEQRDFTSMTFVGSREQMDMVRTEFRKFHERIMSLMNDGEKNSEVYRLSISFYPLNFDGEEL